MSNLLNNLAEYHLWQGKKVRELLREVTDEEFKQGLEEPMTSLYDSVFHILAALETMVILENNIENYQGIYDRLHAMDLPALLERWEELDKTLLDAVNKDENIKITIPHITDKPFDIHVDDFHSQYILHTVYHRSQIMWVLRKLGKKTQTLDYIFYLAEK